MTSWSELTCETSHVDVLAKSKRLQWCKVAVIFLAARITMLLGQSIQITIVQTRRWVGAVLWRHRRYWRMRSQRNIRVRVWVRIGRQCGMHVTSTHSIRSISGHWRLIQSAMISKEKKKLISRSTNFISQSNCDAQKWVSRKSIDEERKLVAEGYNLLSN